MSDYFGKPLPGGKTVADATDFCTALLEEAHVALVTGDAFGAPGYVRLSFAAAMQNLETGFDRLQKFMVG
ncbi:MAG: aminotransferase class I/II-fold pyridoxal phosphate-dependent enzyme [Planctomycetales bacterium]